MNSIQSDKTPDWILAGHTHGQVTPDTRFWDIAYPTRFKQFVAGEYALGETTRLYVNSGLGCALDFWRDPRAEITLFTLHRAKMRQEAASSGDRTNLHPWRVEPDTPAEPVCQRDDDYFFASV